MGDEHKMLIVMDTFGINKDLTILQYIQSKNRVNANQWTHNKFVLREEHMSSQDLLATEHILLLPNAYFRHCVDYSQNCWVDKKADAHPLNWGPETELMDLLTWGLRGLRPEAGQIMGSFSIPRRISNTSYEHQKITEQQWNNKKTLVDGVIPATLIGTVKYILLNPRQYADQISRQAGDHCYPMVPCPNMRHRGAATSDRHMDALVVANPHFNFEDINTSETEEQRLRRTHIDQLWRKHNSIDAPIEMDTTASFSITTPQFSRETARLISDCTRFRNVRAEHSVITDGTACTGGNVFEFSSYFGHVNAVELDPDRAQMLLRNISRSELENVCTFDNDITNPDELRHTDKFRAHSVLFLDPPWGGREYAQKKSLRLRLGDFDLTEVCLMWEPFTRFIALKLPMNFDMHDFHHNIDAKFRVMASQNMLRHAYRLRERTAVFQVVVLERQRDMPAPRGRR